MVRLFSFSWAFCAISLHFMSYLLTYGRTDVTLNHSLLTFVLRNVAVALVESLAAQTPCAGISSECEDVVCIVCVYKITGALQIICRPLSVYRFAAISSSHPCSAKSNSGTRASYMKEDCGQDQRRKFRWDLCL